MSALRAGGLLVGLLFAVPTTPAQEPPLARPAPTQAAKATPDLGWHLPWDNQWLAAAAVLVLMASRRRRV